MTKLIAPILVVALSLPCGCTKWMRDADFYASEVTERLEGRSDAIAGCYDRYLEQTDPTAKGEVTVEFDIVKKTGEFANVKVDPDRSPAPEALQQCVTAELATMRMDPPDTKTAHATIQWKFALGSRKKPPADPFSEAQTVLLGCYETHLATLDREAKGELVVDYAFDRETGALERIDFVQDATTAPAAVVECARPAFESAKLEPEKLDDRNAAGRRSFALRFEPHVAATP
jgi:hypothetical protein